jgi:hypothetical protein
VSDLHWTQCQRGWQAHGTLSRVYNERMMPSGRFELSVDQMDNTGWIQLGLFDSEYMARYAAEHYDQWGEMPPPLPRRAFNDGSWRRPWLEDDHQVEAKAEGKSLIQQVLSWLPWGKS